MFDDFTLERRRIGEVTLRFRHGGTGTPVVLIHGHPRTHLTWHAVADLLAPKHSVVCADLRGYGESSLPPDEPGHAQSSKRAMAWDVVGLMRSLGHERFAVVGHDRGGLVALRTALDHPDTVTALVVMDALPVVEHLERTTAEFAAAWWHWWFLGQTAKPAERVICADPDAWYQTPAAEAMGMENHADAWRAFRNPDVVHGMCEDYRAGLTIDRAHEEDDRAVGRMVQCPMMLLEAADDDLDLHGDPARIWAPWASGPVDRRIIPSGHHQAEEAPRDVADAILDFLRTEDSEPTGRVG
jgi:haloacetate dehalogenase